MVCFPFPFLIHYISRLDIPNIVHFVFDAPLHCRKVGKRSRFHDCMQAHGVITESHAHTHTTMRSAGFSSCGRHLHLPTLDRGPRSVGVPQGPPLSPVLFLVFIDDLLHALIAQTLVQAFANDVVIWWTLGKRECGSAHRNALLEEVLAWARCWKMIFNPAKCKFMVISELCLDGVPFPVSAIWVSGWTQNSTGGSTLPRSHKRPWANYD